MKRVVLLSVVALSAACSKVDDTICGSTTADIAKTSITLIASSEDQTPSSARTSVDGVSVLWTPNDQIAVYGADAAFTLSSEVATKSGEFSGELAIETPQYLYAIYPYSAADATFIGSSHTFTQPTEQVQSYVDGALDTTSIGDYGYMFGKSDSELSEANTLSNITFTHAMAIVDYEFTNLPTDNAITKVVLSPDADYGSLLMSSVYVNLDDPSITAGDYKTTYISVDTNDIVASDGTLSLRIALLPQEVATSSRWYFTLHFADGSTSKMGYEYTEPQTYEAGGCYSGVSLAFSAYSDLQVGAYYYSDGTYSNALISNKVDDVEGVIYKIEGSSAMVVSARTSGEMVWSTEQIATGATDVDNGLANTRTIKALGKAEGVYPPYDACDAVNGDVEYTEGSIGIWYLPAESEISEVLTVTFLPFVNNVAQTYINSQISAAGGDVFVTGSKDYISSTEVSTKANNYRYARCRNDASKEDVAVFGTSKDTAKNLRLIKAVELK